MKRILCILLVCLGLCAVPRAAELSVGEEPFGTLPDGTPIRLFTLTNAGGMTVQAMSYGAILLDVRVPDREGNFENVNLRLDTLGDYLAGSPAFGALIGRFANRIKGARFTIDGMEYHVTPNSRGDHIHGGAKNFSKLPWNARTEKRADSVAVIFTLTRPDGDEGYPGKVDVKVEYELTNDNALAMRYTATTDKPTHINLTNHAYWNLNGAGSGSVLNQQVVIKADQYLPTGEDKIPTGEFRSVEGTPMDFRTPHAIGERIEAVEGENCDHCYVLAKDTQREPAFAARLADPVSGRTMEVFTTQPGVQLYTAKALSAKLSTNGKPYGSYHGVCFETQHFPNSPNEPAFPTTLVRPGEVYRQVTIHRFSVVR